MEAAEVLGNYDGRDYHLGEGVHPFGTPWGPSSVVTKPSSCGYAVPPCGAHGGEWETVAEEPTGWAVVFLPGVAISVRMTSRVVTRWQEAR
ncbi:hypothetical protein R1flu_016462 [Riccia fluitans]|uniref:Uncharacterized protein n=1 Tax=Riccia fluitans TaxID=41844 RepID=A0ABD1YMF5_9MARC